MTTMRATDRDRELLEQTWMLGGLAAALALVGNLVALANWRAVYGDETSMLVDAALAQDIVTAAVVVPLVAVAAVGAVGGDLRSHLLGLGGLAFLTYNYSIYCFSISFGPLFLVWTAVLGLSVFAIVNGVRAAGRVDLGSVTRPSTLAASVLVAVATLFAFLWLSEIVPDLLAGDPSSSANDWDVPTNPVHVLDLGLFLPAAVMTGVSLKRGQHIGLLLAPGMLIWFVLTCLPILLTPVVATVRSADPGWGAVVPVAVIGVAALVALRRTVAPPAR